jgi:hypothetical protein
VPTSLEVKLLALFVKEAAVGVDPTRFEQQYWLICVEAIFDLPGRRKAVWGRSNRQAPDQSGRHPHIIVAIRLFPVRASAVGVGA